MLAWSGRTDPDGNLYSFVSCKGALNYGKYCDPDTDKLLDQSRLVNDPAARKKVLEQIAQKTIPGGPVLYLYHRKMFFPHTMKLQSFQPMPGWPIAMGG